MKEHVFGRLCIIERCINYFGDNNIIFLVDVFEVIQLNPLQ